MTVENAPGFTLLLLSGPGNWQPQCPGAPQSTCPGQVEKEAGLCKEGETRERRVQYSGLFPSALCALEGPSAHHLWLAGPRRLCRLLSAIVGLLGNCSLSLLFLLALSEIVKTCILGEVL